MVAFDASQTTLGLTSNVELSGSLQDYPMVSTRKESAVVVLNNI